MPILEINTLDHPGVDVFSTLTEAQLRNRLEPGKGIFIAESPKVIRVALEAGYEPLALLCERRHLTGDAADIVARCGDIPVYTGDRELLARLTGYVLTRGVLCAMRRPQPRSLDEVCRGARRVVVIDIGEGRMELINPEIIRASGSQVDSEGCLSFPGQYGLVDRPNQVTVRAQDRNGNWYEATGTGLLARAFCHEIDHLDGIVFKDKVSQMLEPEEQRPRKKLSVRLKRKGD